MLMLAAVAGLIVVKRKAGRSDWQPNTAVNVAVSLHHVVTFVVVAAFLVVVVTSSGSLGMPSSAQSNLSVSGIISSVILVVATIGLAAAKYAQSMVTRWLIVGILWSISGGILFLHVSAWMRAFAA